MSLSYKIYKVFLFFRINVLPSMLIYTIFLCVNIKNIKKLSLKKEILKYIYILYILMVLKITGITEMMYELHNLLRIREMEIVCPFLGNSFSMILLNFLLFVPMGLLTPLVISIKWNKKKIFVLGLIISGCIEGLQLLGGRLPETDDILANAMGSYGGFLVLEILKACREKEKNKMRNYIIELIILLVLFFVPVAIVADEDRREYCMYQNVEWILKYCSI